MIQSFLLAVALLAPPSAFAQDPAKPAPQLVRLDKSLTKAQNDKKDGRLDEKRYQEFVAKFRSDLEEAMSRVKPTPPNTALRARILSRLGDSKQALAALGPAIEQDPDSPQLGVALSQVQFDRKDYPAALAAANAVLERDPQNKEAQALKRFSEGRSAAVSDGEAAKPGAADFARLDWTIPEKNDISAKALKLIQQGVAARRKGDVEGAWGPIQAAMNADPTSTSVQAIYGKFKADRADYRETRTYLANAADAMHAGRGEEALSWAHKAYERHPTADIQAVVDDVQRRTAARAQTPSAPKDDGPDPPPSAPLGKAGAAGAAAGLAAWLVLRRRSDNQNVRGPLMALAVMGIGATGSVLIVGGRALTKPHAVTDVGMNGENRAPLLQGEPNVAQAPGGRPDCAEQLKKTYPLQQDAQQKRQGALVALQPILDKYELSYEKFQAEFPKLAASYVASCDADPAACQLMANKADWAAAQASYGQIQSLDQKLLVLSGILAKLTDLCAVPGGDEKGKGTKKDADESRNRETENGTLAKREAVATAETPSGKTAERIPVSHEAAPDQKSSEAGAARGESASPNAKDNLDRKLRALEQAQKDAEHVRNLPDGRVRFYGPEKPAQMPGPTRGRRLVTEFDSKTGQVRQWMENYDHSGKVVRIHPKLIDGQVVESPHYPPTGKELAP